MANPLLSLILLVVVLTVVLSFTSAAWYTSISRFDKYVRSDIFSFQLIAFLEGWGAGGLEIK